MAFRYVLEHPEDWEIVQTEHAMNYNVYAFRYNGRVLGYVGLGHDDAPLEWEVFASLYRERTGRNPI